MNIGNRIDLTTNKCSTTFQRHGFAIDAATLPSDFRPFFVNLNDDSNEGFYRALAPRARSSVYSFIQELEVDQWMQFSSLTFSYRT